MRRFQQGGDIRGATLVLARRFCPQISTELHRWRFREDEGDGYSDFYNRISIVGDGDVYWRSRLCGQQNKRLICPIFAEGCGLLQNQLRRVVLKIGRVSVFSQNSFH
ncbi:MAG: hypothetical protein JWM04_1900 [Verrucomicrobiales bacterium]|nr:hypothetical protein [Verrucomicrobiales bacterium]